MESAIKQSEKQIITIIDRRTIQINGIRSISALDGDFVALESDLGRITIEGDDLEVLELESTTGCIRLTGEVNGVYYEDSKEKKRKGLFG